MKNLQDPKYKDDLDFKSTDDCPENNGSYRDEARIVPMRFANDDEDILDDGTDEWDENDFGEQFD